MAALDPSLRDIETYVPPGCFVRLIEELEAAYAAAAFHCLSSLAEPEAHDLVAHYRRSLVETAMAAVGHEFQHRGIVVAAVPNVTGSAFHREMRAGPVVLTASFVDSPDSLVELADFRMALAQRRQLPLHGIIADDSGEYYYAIILHGVKRIGHRRSVGELGFVRLAVPNADCSKYLDVFDLVDQYAEAEVTTADMDAANQAGVPIEKIRRPSALLLERRQHVSKRRA